MGGERADGFQCSAPHQKAWVSICIVCVEKGLGEHRSMVYNHREEKVNQPDSLRAETVGREEIKSNVSQNSDQARKTTCSPMRTKETICLICRFALKGNELKIQEREFPPSPVVRAPCSQPGARVHSLIRELRPHKLHSTAKKFFKIKHC